MRFRDLEIVFFYQTTEHIRQTCTRWGCLGTPGALEPVDSVQLRDVSGAIRCDAQVRMRSTFGSIAAKIYQKLRPDLDFPRVQGGISYKSIIGQKYY